MRVLFLSNFYPPARPGGYTQWCHEVAQRLQGRGHTVGVLTSRYESDKAPETEQGVVRSLHLESDLFYYRPLDFFTVRRGREQENLVITRRVLEAFAPDIVFVWGMWALSKKVPALAEQLLPGRVVYYLSDYWPSALDMHTAYWRQPAARRLMRLPRQLLGAAALAMLAREGKPALRFEHVITVSAAVRDILVGAGVPIHHARVIHGGTDVERLLALPASGKSTNGALGLLYAGQLVPHKGVHTAIEALAKLVHERRLHHIRLTLVGDGHPEYKRVLHSLVRDKGLGGYITFHGSASKSEMASILKRFEVLVFPSVYEEPFARMTQEAMAAGMVVVGTTTGGTKEILVEAETGLTFTAEDSDALARQLERLVDDPALRQRLAEAGQRTVLERFTLDRMVDEIEGYLQQVVV